MKVFCGGSIFVIQQTIKQTTSNKKQTNIMAEMTKKVDALGFDKFQIANVKRAYAANKVTYRKMDTIADKIHKLHEQYEALRAETESFEGAVKKITQRVLGMDLTSREVLAYHENPSLFAQNHPDHPLSASIREMSGVTVENEGTDMSVDVPVDANENTEAEVGVGNPEAEQNDPFNM